ncbi:MAG: hypothetical protein KA715_00460 [Xanthomonadaceae bacterium]|nr:hypothetical protein [Xanthomonadaceae bacterium]
MANPKSTRLQEQIGGAWERYRTELHEKRLEYAKKGFKLFRDHHVLEAVQNYQTYIKIIEEWKQVPEGGLRPDHFHLEKDKSELLLLTGIYWDLVKVYDRSKGPQATKDFKRYLEQYIIFSRGTKHGGIALDTIRKYMMANKPIHKAEFKNAFKRLGGTDCFVVTSLLDHVDFETLDAMRGFRDESLSQSSLGRLFIKVYYSVGPGVAWSLDQMPNFFRAGVARFLDLIAKKL